jgi:hypothetical protein
VIERTVLSVEIAILSALILAARCANYRDVFIAGNVYFIDPDRYARLTRLRARVRFRTGGAEFLAILGLAVPRHALCSILDRTSAQVPRFLIFASKPCGQTLSVWQISSVKKVNAACENALTSHESVTI